MRRIVLFAGFMTMASMLTGSLADAQTKDPTQSWLYRGTNWVDRPGVQRYVDSSSRFYRENRDIIRGTVQDAVRGKKAPYLILKGVFGYPREAR
jgi:hypothetical protein